MVAHCLSELPNEGCGLVASRGDVVVALYPARNLASSSTEYTLDPADHMAALMDSEKNGAALSGVFHSHPGGDALMSRTDISRALDPDWMYIVIGLRKTPQIGVFAADGSALDTQY